jgi:hypothetical protein
MKALKFFTALMLITIIVSHQKLIAQNQPTGLYITFNDYLNHKLSYTTTQTGNKIKLNNTFSGSQIMVLHDGKKQPFVKSEVFGYHYKNQDYRYFKNSAYQIVDTRDFYIYSRPTLVQHGKTLKSEANYYFSLAPGEDIKPLTIADLETAYARNPKFKYLVEGEFKSDNDLIAYDASIKEYKLKYLFDESTNK